MAAWGRSSPTKEIMLQSSVVGDIGLVQSLMALDPNALHSRNCHGLSVLQLAIIHRHFRLAEYFIQEGVNVQLKDNLGWTALHDAALYSSSTLVEILLQYGSNIMGTNNKGERPIDVAGDVAMETLLCDKMALAGHSMLAYKYKTNFGLFSAQVGEAWSDGPEEDINTGTVVNNSNQMENRRSLANKEVSFSCDHRGHGNASSISYSYSSMNNSDNPEEASFSCSTLHKYSGFRTPSIQHSNADRYKSAPLSPLPECLVENRESFNTTDFLDIENSGASSQPRRRVTSPVPKRKLSIAGLVPMYQSDGHHLHRSQSFDNFSDRTSPPSVSRLNSELTRSSSDLRMHLTGEKRDTPKRSGEMEKIVDRETPIELLKMRPRKPSIIDATRRRSRENDSDRRSVSFQPEVLLQEVVTEGDVIKVKEIIKSGLVEDVNKISPVGLTALHQSALDGNLECARTLVLNGADVNSVDVEGWTPLHAAAATGHADIVRFLLCAGSNPVMKNDQDETPYDVAKKGSIQKMLLRASSGKTADHSDDEISDGEFSSEEEEEYSHAESDSEDDVCFSDSDTMLTLSWNKIKSLRKSSARENLVSPCPQREPDSVFTELQNPSTLASALLKDRELSDSTSSYGSMTEQDLERHDVAKLYDSETSSVRILCNEDTNLTDTDRETDQGFSTMDASSDSSHRRILFSDDEGTSRDVLDADLEPGTYDYKFQEAVLNCDVEAVTKLLKFKSNIDVNRINSTSGISALHHAVLEENYALVQHLVCDFKCEVNLKDIDGWTPLHAASAVGSIRIAQFLLEHGAKASILNNNCEFPVDVTDEESMEALLKKAMLGPTIGKMFKGVFR